MRARSRAGGCDGERGVGVRGHRSGGRVGLEGGGSSPDPEGVTWALRRRPGGVKGSGGAGVRLGGAGGFPRERG